MESQLLIYCNLKRNIMLLLSIFVTISYNVQFTVFKLLLMFKTLMKQLINLIQMPA